MSLRDTGSRADELVLSGRESEMETTMTETQVVTQTELVDEFLQKHGHTLPVHVIDFALDMRHVIAEFEQEQDREPEPVG